MAVPKKRTTAASKGQRRSHDALKAVSLSSCSNCQAPVLPHNVCKACGFYRGKKLIAKV